MSNIGIGITTYNRPESFRECLDSILEFAPVGSRIFINDDGSHVDYDDAFRYAEKNGCIVFKSPHKNIAASKNILLQAMIDDGCYDLFLIEDDMKAMSSKAFETYIKVSQETSIHHLLFAHHGNRNFMYAQNDLMTLHYECVGSWCYYTADAINQVGLMDENFDNCWEHVVHSMLIGDSGLMDELGWRRWPDVKGSHEFINEIDTPSTHAPLTEHELMTQARVQKGLRHWKNNYRFPDDLKPLLR
jgi:glycosyltransferase involved in cell wall biosynthesis